MATRNEASRRVRWRKGGLVALVALLVGMLALSTSPVAAERTLDDEKSNAAKLDVAKPDSTQPTEKPDGSPKAHITVEPGESIQAAIDAAVAGTRIVVIGHHVENVWIYKSGISLVGKNGSIAMPETPTEYPCGPTLICVIPLSILEVEFPDPPPNYLAGVSIRGLALTNPIGDAIGTIFTNNVDVRRNTIVDPGCDGVFVLFATGFNVTRNHVTGAQCGGINVSASSDGLIARNTTNDSAFNGIAGNDVSKVRIRRNTASGNCIGIGVADGPDEGSGVQEEDFPSRNVRIARNNANGNNAVCFPFGPGIPIGVTGILVAGVSDVTVKRNIANNNTSAETTDTAAGIFVTDFPNEDGTPFSVTTDAKVVKNTAKGNTSGAGPADVFVPSVGSVKVKHNKCQFGVPNPNWCKS